MAKSIECKYRVTATIKADTKYELEVIKAKLTKAGANILRIDPLRSSRKSLQAHQNMQLDLEALYLARSKQRFARSSQSA